MSLLAFFFNFVSVYEILGIINSLYDIIRQEILYYIYHSPSTKKMTFREAIINNSFRNVPELEVEMISSIIGELLLKSLGLEISYIIFYFVNIICLIVLLLFPFQSEDNLGSNLSRFEFIELIVIIIFLYISVGGCALLIYQKFLEYTAHNNINFFIIPLVISICSMFLKNQLNYWLVKSKRYFLLFHVLIYIISSFISFILQFLIDKERKEESFGIDFNCCDNKIFGINFEKLCRCCLEKKNKKTILEKKFEIYDLCGYIY